MAQSLNQFAQGAEKGMMDLRVNPTVISVQLDVSSSGGVLPATAVKMVDSAGGVPKVVECAADTDDVFGFVCLDPRKASRDDYANMEVAMGSGSVMYMEAGAAIARNAALQIVVSGSKVITAVSTKRVIGKALDKATASGQLIRVLINLPGILAP